MCDHADHAPITAELLDRLDDDLERLGIEGAEPFVEEQRIEAGSLANR